MAPENGHWALGLHRVKHFVGARGQAAAPSR